MRRWNVRGVATLCVAMSLASICSAAPLGQGSVIVDAGGRMEGSGGVVNFSYLLDSNVIFDFNFTEYSVGETWTLTSGAEFDAAVATLTNGVNDMTPFSASLGPVSGGTTNLHEAGFFFGNDSGVNGIDFQSFTITAISFTLDNLTIVAPGDDPNQDSQWAEFSLKGTVSIEGVGNPPSNVPEPMNVAVWGVTLLGGWFWHRRRSAAEACP